MGKSMHWYIISLVGTLSFPAAFVSASAILGSGLDASNLFADMKCATTQGTVEGYIPASKPFKNSFVTRQNEGRCGPDVAGQRCPGNQCCSSYGYCGDSNEHCAEIVGCQPQYGRCGSQPVEPTTTPTLSPTPTPTSTPSTTVSTSTSSTSTTILPPLPSSTLAVSQNGLCGNSTTCAGSGFGNCCSEWYWCGSSVDHCGTGCHIGFGSCGGGPLPSSSSSASPLPSSSPAFTSSRTLTPTSSSMPTSTPSSTGMPISSSTRPPIPTPTSPVSTDGQCGTNSRSCTGSAFGRCCSEYGWCGSDEQYCKVSWGCQPAWGQCGVQVELFGR